MMAIKIGGSIAVTSPLIIALANELAQQQNKGMRIALIHGGGSTISNLQEQWKFPLCFKQGRRQTSSAEMSLVDMALAGAVNKQLVRLFSSLGIAAWGLCGADASLITGRRIDDENDNLTGVVAKISMRPLEMLWKENYLPIIAPPATDFFGVALNINADEAALAISKAGRASCLLFLSDVQGVLRNGEVIPSITSADAEILIAEGTVNGGMVPKLRSAAEALQSGVQSVHIAAYGKEGDLQRILSGEQGTQMMEAE